MPQPLAALVEEVAALLQRSGRRVVFAESCTGGLVAASLARVPGISEFLCGSAVVYRLETKARWLGVPEALLADPGPVSDVVARAMAIGVLARTPEADLAASITGHFGPNAPGDQDGLIFIGIARRNHEAIHGATVDVFQDRLTSNVDAASEFTGLPLRERRQWLAVERVLTHLRSTLSNPSDP